MLLLRSLLFSFLMYLAMAVMGILWAIPAVIKRDWAYWIMQRYCDVVFWLLRVIVNIKVEFRGEVPAGEVIVAAKHQSFLDIIMLMGVLPRAKFIMKKSVKWTPIIGFYAMQIGCAPVDRGKKGASAEMVRDVSEQAHDPGQIVIYPQGTRVAPGISARYKRGTAILYQTFNLPVVPAATNAGLFWRRNSWLRHPGTAVISFLPTIPVGLGDAEFMTQLETEIEVASTELLDI